MRENGRDCIAGDTSAALAAFISAVDTEELMQLAILYTKGLAVEHFLPLADGAYYEDSLGALANISATIMLEDTLTSIEMATWVAFLKVFAGTPTGEAIFENMVATMPLALYVEVSKDFVNHIKTMTLMD